MTTNTKRSVCPASCVVCFYLQLVMTEALSDPCPFGWTRKAPEIPRCIRLFEKPVSWANASGICRENYGDLVTFMDDILKLSVWGLVAEHMNTSYWVGVEYSSQEDTFLDTEDEANYTNWIEDAPNPDGRKAKCRVLYTDWLAEESWGSENCSSHFPFICEKFLDFQGYPLSECENQTYGANCSENCSPNCAGPEKACSNIDGSCTSGCDFGYQGEKCDTACDQRTYGENCSEICSPNCAGLDQACDNVNGSCISGCDVGYQGEKCDAACDQRTYGENCSEICSPNCAGLDQACDNVNGSCISGCDVGYQGEKCDAACDQRTYGENCSEICSPNCAGLDQACDNVNGSCISGCDNGYVGEKCDSFDEKPSVESAVAPLARTAKVFLAIIFIAAGALFSLLIGVLAVPMQEKLPSKRRNTPEWFSPMLSPGFFSPDTGTNEWVDDEYGYLDDIV